MANLDKIRRNAEILQSFLEQEYCDDPRIIVERGNCICSWLAWTTTAMADAKNILNSAKTTEICNLIKTTFAENKLSAQVQNKLLDSICSDEQYLVDLLHEQNKTLKHQLEWCRSLISKYKTELAATNLGPEFSN